MPSRQNHRICRLGLLAGIAICLSLPGTAWGATTGASSSCPNGEIRTASGCASFAEAGREVRSIVRRTVNEQDLKAALVRVDVGNRTLATATPGESMAGVPATPRMNFRIGAVAIPYVVDLLLQLQDRGDLSLDDPVGKWLPNLPNADRVTLRMLASSTSGYPDWIQGNPQFQEELLADVFRRWTTPELLGAAFDQPLICGPGECFHYAHTNFAILGKVIHQVTGRPVEQLLRRRVLKPLHLRHTEISGLPGIPDPVLHTYTADRGSYEDSTYWSPSYGLPQSMLMTATIADLVKSAKAMGTGALISRQASRERFAPITAGLPGIPGPQFSHDFYFGLGVLVLNSWQFQNPEINGYKSISAYLPSRRISLAITSTEGPSAAKTGTNLSAQLFNDIALYLTPGHPAVPAG
jgi:CubicO group peptidase (beta-lactamase class C family)